MDPDKAGLGALFQSLVGELSFPGRIAAFFGGLLTLVGIFTVSAPLLLSGVALLSFAISNYYWRNRHIGVYYTGQELRWYQDLIWSNVFLALLFFAGFVAAGYFWIRLPSVTKFLRLAGIG